MKISVGGLVISMKRKGGRRMMIGLVAAAADYKVEQTAMASTDETRLVLFTA